MKKILPVMACALTFVVAAIAAPRYLMVTGAGVGTETDQSSAHEDADSQAKTNLENACPGKLTSPKKIFDQCSQIDGNYVCSINYTGICEIGN